MAGKTGRNGNAQKNYYGAYPAKAEKNRKARQERHQKRHPNDKQKVVTRYRKVKPENISGWLTPKMDDLLTPVQTTPITVTHKDGRKETLIPECAESLKNMTKAERKRFAALYARARKVQSHATMYGKKKGKKRNK